MRIGLVDGPSVQLEVLGYEFPVPARQATDVDWDANWLLVKGTVTPGDGRGWSFTDACLTTFEARELADWLRRVALGEIPPTPFDVKRWGDAGLRCFTEPVLGFSVAELSPKRAAIRIHLSFGALPPWVSFDHLEIYENFVLVQTTASELALAVDDWLLELAAFPVR